MTMFKHAYLMTAVLSASGLAFFSACSSSSDDPASGPQPDTGDHAGDERPAPAATLTAEEWVQAKTQSPLPAVPPDPTNKYADNPNAARLGQAFYFETGYSGPLVTPSDLGSPGQSGRVACASCHVLPWGSDTRSSPNNMSLGVNWTGRHSPAVTNSAFYEMYFTDGRADSAWMQATGPVENPNEMASDRMRVASMIYKKYKAEYEAIFGAEYGPLPARLDPANAKPFPLSAMPKGSVSAANGPWETDLTEAERDQINRVFVNFAKSIAAYERLLVSRNAPWDRYVAGDAKAISDSAIRGYKVFVGDGYCKDCHSGPAFTNNKYHNIGIAQGNGPHVPATDNGRAATITGNLTATFLGSGTYSDDRTFGTDKLGKQPDFNAGVGKSEPGLFRTTGLRQIAETAPYMHTGGFATLEEVVHLYAEGGGKSGIGKLDKSLLNHEPMTAQQEKDLVAFLKTLTGDPPPAELMKDTSKR
ncbi:hypothetical protein LVJ94_33720 [Pendulispora rubella]|uniref:Cytochrome c domain-containing protein n=1 Tax=Pendulispora rubella TaxID=2741070 RepID=A0ABZ2KT38_9BACT